ncbi:MAG: hypothetical protein ACFE0O_13515 [Opitutales bacterium]
MIGVFPGIAPLVPVIPDPVEKRSLKADIGTGFFRFQPLVTQDFFPLGKELLIEAGTLSKI